MTLKGDKIFLTKGDSGALTVRREDADGAPQPFGEGDELYLTVKRFPGCAKKLVQKVLRTFEADGAAVLVFAPEDTRALEPGRCWYDIQLRDAGGGVTTLVGPAEFRLGGEVTDD